jgi:hypothetical protein
VSWPIVFLVALVIGAALFGIGTAIVRAGERSTEWVSEVVTGETTLEERLEIVERLGIVNEPWSLVVLARAAADDPERAVRIAASRRTSFVE